MSAQPVHYDDSEQRIDPQRILRVLPSDRAREVFLAEYQDAVRAAADPAGWAALNELLKSWSLRAIAYAKPGFGEGLADVAAGRGDLVSHEDLLRRRREADGAR